MAQSDIRELRNLPLSDLITAPLNAIVEAQASAALSTAQFIEQIGFDSAGEASLFDEESSEDTNKRTIRTAELKVSKKILVTNEDGSQEVKDVDEFVSIPFIALFNIPSIEIDSMEWDFNVKLKSVQSLATSFSEQFKSGFRSKSGSKVGVDVKGINISTNSSMTVEASRKTDFELRFKADRTQEYNLHINIKANQAAPPKGIERLLGIAERIATETEVANQFEAENP